MNRFPLTIATPDGHAFHGEAVKLSLRGSEGDLAIMAGHIPFVTAVKAGGCRVHPDEDTIHIGRTDGGLLTVSREEVTLLCSQFEWVEE